jgi:branched-chain amino acid transport system ATP-binding protein
VISGLLTPSSGTVFFAGEDLAGRSAEARVRLGIAQVPEGRRIFPRLTVRENLLMGAYLCDDDAEIRDRMGRVHELFPVLAARAAQPGATLSGGEQQMLAIGRALMGRPRLLVLDEPSLGLAPLLVERIFGVIREIHARGCAVVLVEQNARQALRLVRHGYVLETGRLLIQGPAEVLLHDEVVRRAYLGG